MDVRLLEEARLWLAAAGFVAAQPSESATKHAVAVSMSIHAILKANDALTLRFLNTTAKRHDDARRLFEDMVRTHHIRPSSADCAAIIQDAVDDKARAEYRGGVFSKRDFERLASKAERFISMARQHLEPHTGSP